MLMSNAIFLSDNVRVVRRVHLVGQELLTSEAHEFTPVFSGVRVAQSFLCNVLSLFFVFFFPFTNFLLLF